MAERFLALVVTLPLLLLLVAAARFYGARRKGTGDDR